MYPTDYVEAKSTAAARWWTLIAQLPKGCRAGRASSSGYLGIFWGYFEEYLWVLLGDIWGFVGDILMGCGAAEATGLGFVCFIVINPCVLSTNIVDFGLFLFHNFSNFTSVPDRYLYTIVFIEISFVLRVDLGFFCFINFLHFTPPPRKQSMRCKDRSRRPNRSNPLFWDTLAG